MKKDDKKLKPCHNKPDIPDNNEICAIRYRDNSSGDGDIYFTLAYMGDDGIWLDEHSGNELLTHAGDEILEWWPLTVGTGNKAIIKA